MFQKLLQVYLIIFTVSVSAAAASQPSSSIPQASTCTPLSSWSQGARRKAKARAYATFPHSPCRLVETLNDIVHSLAPRKKQLFKTLQPESLEHRIGKSVIFELKKNNTRRNKDLLHTRHVLLNTCQKYLNLRGSSSIRAVSKGSILSLAASKHMKREKMKKEIEEYYKSVSCPIPDKKLVSSKTGQAASLLTKPLREVYDDFVAAQPAGSTKVSFSHFAKCKPRYIYPRQDWRLRMCLCEYCTNIDLKLRTLNAITGRTDNAARIRHGYHAIDLLTCGRDDGIWQKKCAYRECVECQDQTLKQHTARLLQHQRPLTWL